MPQNEQLRRTTISLQVLSSPNSAIIGGTIGPVVLHMALKVVSIGCAEGPLKVTGDSSVKPEHGLISYRADTVLYVCGSRAPTKIDGQTVDPDGGPIELRSGATLQIGETQLLVTTFTEFATE